MFESISFRPDTPGAHWELWESRCPCRAEEYRNALATLTDEQREDAIRREEHLWRRAYRAAGLPTIGAEQVAAAAEAVAP